MSAVQVGHQAIRASAGAGKTYRLAHRYIRLLHLGVAPESIVALTFSRKAAGEIFASIIECLCRAAEDKAKAEQASELVGESLPPARYEALLAGLLKELHRARISTIDSFQVGILRAFALEWNLPPAFTVTDGKQVDAAQLRLAARRQLVGIAQQHQNVRDALIRTLMDASPQSADAKVTVLFDRLIEDLTNKVRALPDKNAWGNETRIWTTPPAWLTPPLSSHVQTALQVLQKKYVSTLTNDYAIGKWTEFLNALYTWQPEQSWSNVKYLGDLLIEDYDKLAKGSATISLKRKDYPIPSPYGDPAFLVTQHLISRTVRAKLDNTAAAYELVINFQEYYQQQARDRGVLTFDDVPHLLAGTQASVRQPALDDILSTIQYRLDGQIDHWLIDEFQDTSDQQWQVLYNLIREVLEDPEGQRSVFLVGDIKQSIYGFRGGNPRLFERVLDDYEAKIERIDLAESWRSQPAILDTVNRVFEAMPELKTKTDSVDIAPVWERWQSVWSPHKMATDKQEQSAYAGLWQVGKDTAACWAACAALINRIEPLKRGLSVAVLVSKNDTGKALANHLRAHCRVPVTTEGRTLLAEHPTVLVLLSLLQYALHPGDELARQHVRMSPLRERFEQEADPLQLLRQVETLGVAAWVRDWSASLIEAAGLDAYSQHRLTLLAESAREYEAQPGRSLADFLTFARAYTVADEETASSVRVMTIHAAKGLGFDVVIMPELSREIRATWESGVQLGHDEDEQPCWALDMPPTSMVVRDPTLRACRDRVVENGTFENLCGLYVGMTRAKRALYMLALPPGSSDNGNKYAHYLRQQLATGDPRRMALGEEAVDVLYEQGRIDWYEDEALQSPEKADVGEIGPITFRSAEAAVKRRFPQERASARAESARAGSLLFERGVRDSLRLGTVIHGLFEQISWLDEVDGAAALAQWEAAQGAVDEKALALFTQALAAADFQEALARPARAYRLWREQSFEAILDGRWVTGTIDRAVLWLDDAGRVTGAEILDYKTNQVADEAAIKALCAHYRPQLQTYAQALSRLTGLSLDRIALKLALTRAGRVVDVDA
jgi:ATP-dependent helicase/nuclease subunit A